MLAELRFMEMNQSLFGDRKWLTKEALARHYLCSPRTIKNYLQETGYTRRREFDRL